MYDHDRSPARVRGWFINILCKIESEQISGEYELA
jgi:hypothetical protein